MMLEHANDGYFKPRFHAAVLGIRTQVARGNEPRHRGTASSSSWQTERGSVGRILYIPVEDSENSMKQPFSITEYKAAIANVKRKSAPGLDYIGL